MGQEQFGAEELPKHDQSERAEVPPSRAEVVQSLKDDKYNRTLLDAFLSHWEADAKNPKDILNLKIELAEMFVEAKLNDAAFATYSEAASLASDLNDDTLYADLCEKIEELAQ